MTITSQDLPAILEKHRKWALCETGGERAYLEGANLKGANLEGANLEGAYLEGAYLEGAYLERANLKGANLEGANLEGAYLKGAYLKGAYLKGAYLKGANLEGANLEGANLEGAYLEGAYLERANLKGANLEGANLKGAYLKGANLKGAYLEGANLKGANLKGAKDADIHIARTRILPEGALIGYKKCADGLIVKLRIPEAAKRSHAFGRKCRAEYAEVLEITGPRGGARDVAYSTHDSDFAYRPGETVKPVRPFSENWMDECESGIHFFITRIEAENY